MPWTTDQTLIKSKIKTTHIQGPQHFSSSQSSVVCSFFHSTCSSAVHACTYRPNPPLNMPHPSRSSTSVRSTHTKKIKIITARERAPRPRRRPRTRSLARSLALSIPPLSSTLWCFDGPCSLFQRRTNHRINQYLPPPPLSVSSDTLPSSAIYARTPACRLPYLSFAS